MKAPAPIIIRMTGHEKKPEQIVADFARDLAAFASAILFIGGVGVMILALSVPQ